MELKIPPPRAQEDLKGGSQKMKDSTSYASCLAAPGSSPNRINLDSKGVIPVAILTTNSFDATRVDPLSVRFGPNGAIETHRRGHLDDADKDGFSDMLLHFSTPETGIGCLEKFAVLTGSTIDGILIRGADSIRPHGRSCPN